MSQEDIPGISTSVLLFLIGKTALRLFSNIVGMGFMFLLNICFLSGQVKYSASKWSAHKKYLPRNDA